MSSPLVILDTTIADLYNNHGIQGSFLAYAQPVFSQLDLHAQLPREATYPEDADAFSSGDSEVEIAQLRKLVWDLKPIKRVFALGNMDVILFTRSPENTEGVLAQLPPNQRPKPCFIDLDQGDLLNKLEVFGRGRKLLYWSPQGWMRNFDCMVDTNLSYEINSKRYLTSSEIRTPESMTIDLGVDKTYLTNLRSKDLPFVVKLPRACSGHGTWLVTTEARRRNMLSEIDDYLSRGGKEIVVSAYIHTKLELGVHFVVGANGDARDRNDPVIVAVTFPSFNANGHWNGGSIDYSAQSALKGLVRDTVRQTTRLLPEGFVGWAGLDILVDEKGEQWIVDLNARWTASVNICLLSNHFFKDRDLAQAAYGSVSYEGAAAEDIFDILSLEISSGEIVVVAIASMAERSNKADLIWGGRSKEDLAKRAKCFQAKLSRRAEGEAMPAAT